MLHNFKNATAKYLYFLLSSTLQKTLSAQKLGNTMPYIKLGMLTSFKIPLPPLNMQEQIVAELDGYQKVMDGAKQVVANWKPQIKINPNWEMAQLGKICDVNKDNVEIIKDIEYNYIDISSIENNGGVLNLGVPILGVNLPSRAKRKIKINDVLLSTVRPYLKAFMQMKTLPENPIVSTGFAVLSPKENLDSGWLYWLLFSDLLQEQMIQRMGKGSYPSINQTDVKNLKIPFPTMEEQNKIVADIESEQAAVNQCKELIAKMEQKIADKIGEVWGN